MCLCTLNVRISIHPHLVHQASLVSNQYWTDLSLSTVEYTAAQQVYYPFLQMLHLASGKNPIKRK